MREREVAVYLESAVSLNCKGIPRGFVLRGKAAADLQDEPLRMHVGAGSIVCDVHVAVYMVGVALFVVCAASPDEVASDGYIESGGGPIGVGFVEIYVQLAGYVQVGICAAYQGYLGRVVYRIVVPVVRDSRGDLQILVEVVDYYRRVRISGNEARLNIRIDVHPEVAVCVGHLQRSVGGLPNGVGIEVRLVGPYSLDREILYAVQIYISGFLGDCRKRERLYK